MKPITLDPTTMSEAGALAIATLLDQLAAEAEHLATAVPEEFEASLLMSADQRRQQAGEIREIIVARRRDTATRQAAIRARATMGKTHQYPFSVIPPTVSRE